MFERKYYGLSQLELDNAQLPKDIHIDQSLLYYNELVFNSGDDSELGKLLKEQREIFQKRNVVIIELIHRLQNKRKIVNNKITEKLRDSLKEYDRRMITLESKVYDIQNGLSSK